MLCKIGTKYFKQYKTFYFFCNTNHYVTYVQGQSPEPKIREYFYYIDHQGMLFLDDTKLKNFTSCFKDKKFLAFFFKRIRLNDSARYIDEFPFISYCGRERNYIRCDDLPIVMTHLVADNNGDYVLLHNHAGDLLKHEFQPNKIYMSAKSGRVYHPSLENHGFISLIRSKLAIEISQHFEFKNGEQQPPSNFLWKNIKYDLDTAWIKNTIKRDCI